MLFRSPSNRIKDLFSISCLPCRHAPKVALSPNGRPYGCASFLLMRRAAQIQSREWLGRARLKSCRQAPLKTRALAPEVSLSRLAPRTSPMWKSSGNSVGSAVRTAIDGICRALYVYQVSRTVGFVLWAYLISSPT